MTCLSAKDPSVTLMASNTLANVESALDIPYLEDAIASEEDAELRSAMERDLKALQTKPTN